ncbi:hypothetical protein BT93_L3498 [Corymbia citriodora subsp. variegata]|uniref:Uncharacterized protein n=1 Tax=Corymbia citriodora subsp. variegata TaxID=360336 RepID=A0A8T0CZS5_CORYI|nr:hypothetical protein BT93_L3498 [Corymbia citriodora subsp. variegata]KAF7851616.1 hypothetical protein BT93_L3498 [Corymbia citriodora subsp. variegata]KAF7851617.1 hypothetical protein BT93_L3498 [Corymbia citriodora subsp. variegata]
MVMESLGVTPQTLPTPPPSYPGVLSAAPIRRPLPASSDPLHRSACCLRLRHRLYEPHQQMDYGSTKFRTKTCTGFGSIRFFLRALVIQPGLLRLKNWQIEKQSCRMQSMLFNA